MTGKGTGRHSEEGSEEDIIPMEKIQARNELEGGQEREMGSVSQKECDVGYVEMR